MSNMEISKEQQRSLVQEVADLIEENETSNSVLERANRLAIIVFGILSSIDNDEHSVGFALQDYAYNSLQASKGDDGARAWIEENKKTLKDALESKFR